MSSKNSCFEIIDVLSRGNQIDEQLCQSSEQDSDCLVLSDIEKNQNLIQKSKTPSSRSDHQEDEQNFDKYRKKVRLNRNQQNNSIIIEDDNLNNFNILDNVFREQLLNEQKDFIIVLQSASEYGQEQLQCLTFQENQNSIFSLFQCELNDLMRCYQSQGMRQESFQLFRQGNQYLQQSQHLQLNQEVSEPITIRLKYNVSKPILQVLDQQNFQQLFRSDFNHIEREQQIKSIRVYNIDIENLQMFIQVECLKNQQECVKKMIRHSIIDQLIIKIVEISFDLLLSCHNLKLKHEFEMKYNCYVQILDEQKFQYVTLNKYVKEIEESIYSVINSINQIERWIKVKSNIIYTKALEAIQNSQKVYRANIRYHQDQNSIQLIGQQEFVNQDLEYINEIINKVKEQLYTLRITYPQNCWVFLELKQKHKIEKIMNKNQCFYDCNNIQQDAQIVADLKFHNKQVLIKRGIFIRNDAHQFQETFNKINVQTFKNYDDFRELNKMIEILFKKAEQKNLKTLVIPILTGQQPAFLFQTACRQFLKKVITLFQSSPNVEQITIIDINSKKVEILVNQLKDLLHPHRIQKENYIQSIYEIYEENLLYSDDYLEEQFLSQVPTHQINLQLMIITHIKLNTMQKLTIGSYQNEQRYFINGRPTSALLNQFIVQQLAMNIQIFNICSNQNKPILKRFELTIEQKGYSVKWPQLEINIKSFEIESLEQSKLKIDKLINKKIISYEWQVLNLKKEDLMEIEEYLLKNSLGFKGRVRLGNKIQIKCAQKKLIKLQQYLTNIVRDKLIYPQTWAYQEKNYIKVTLNAQFDEYKQVEQQFKKSYPQGRIYQVNRIQNQQLYENFINEQNRLLMIKQNQGQTLTNVEINRYLWHGVKSTHPSIVYKSENEAFKSVYCRMNKNGGALGLWGGPATYFAEKAKYAKAYAYKLTPQDSFLYEGKFVLLLCQVTTGICAFSNPCNQLKEPPVGYDCIEGTSNNSQIYVLYGMDSRRAYPSYEIIFE